MIIKTVVCSSKSDHCKMRVEVICSGNRVAHFSALFKKKKRLKKSIENIRMLRFPIWMNIRMFCAYAGISSLFYEHPLLSLFRPAVQFFHTVLFSSSPSPPSLHQSPQLTSTLLLLLPFMFFYPTLVLSLTVNTCVFLWRCFQLIQGDESRCWCYCTQWTHQRLMFPWLIHWLIG